MSCGWRNMKTNFPWNQFSFEAAIKYKPHLKLPKLYSYEAYYRAPGVRICVIYVKLNQTCKNFCENEAGVIEFYSFTLGTRERNSIYSITPASISRKIQTKSYIFSVKSTQEVQMPFVPLHSVDKFLIIRSCSK